MEKVIYHHRTQGRGVEAVHIMGVARGLRQLGYEVQFAGPPGTNPDPDRVVSAESGKTGSLWGPIARFAPQPLFELLEVAYNLAAVPRLWQQCRRERPAFLYERYANFNAAGAMVSRLTGIPLVLEVNDTVKVDRTRQGKGLCFRGLAAAFERYIFHRAAGIATVSGYLKERVMETGVAAERITTTPNAVDAERFNPETVDAEAVRGRLGLTGRTVVGFIGSFTKWHGVDLLVQAGAELAREFPDLALLLVGDGAMRPQIEAQVAELGIEDRVVFTGKVPHAQVPELIRALDIGVMPASNVFGSPVKVFEYMAMGVPPVAPNYSTLQEVVEHNATGLLFEPGQPGSLADCLRRLLADAGARERFGQEARRAVLARHLWVHNAQAVVALAGLGRTKGAPQASLAGAGENA